MAASRSSSVPFRVLILRRGVIVGCECGAALRAFRIQFAAAAATVDGRGVRLADRGVAVDGLGVRAAAPELAVNGHCVAVDAPCTEGLGTVPVAIACAAG